MKRATMLGQLLNISKHIVGLKTGRVFLPNYGIFMLTRRCNMSCAMCGVDKQNGENDIDIDSYEKLFATGLKRLDVVKITGGEPFIRKDACEIMALILEKAKPRIFHITTNGYYTGRIIQFLNGCRKSKISLSISIDGIGDIHNKIRGCSDAFEKAMDSIKAIKSDFGNVMITANCTISTFNYDSISTLKPFLKEMGVDRIAYFIADSNKKYDDHLGLKTLKQSQDNELINSKKVKLYNMVEQNNRNQGITYRLLNKYYMAGLRIHFNNKGRLENMGHNCMALRSYFRMEPNGDIVLCVPRPITIGNVATQKFSEIWYGDRAKKFRRIAISCNECWKECEVIPSCVYSGDLFRFLITGSKQRVYLDS